MKLTINQNKGISDLEVMINCPAIDRRVRNLIDYIRQYSSSLLGMIDGMTVPVPLDTILYVESVDRKTFFYDKRRVFRAKESLTELEALLENNLFERISKNCIVNIAQIASTYTLDNHRLGIMLKNNERLEAGRTYADKLLTAFQTYSLKVNDSFFIEEDSKKLGNILCSIRNNDHILRFREVPQRIVAMTYICAELLCALGLEKKIVSIADVDKDIEYLLPDNRNKLRSIPLIQNTEPNSGSLIPVKDDLDAMAPDFIFCTYYFDSYWAAYSDEMPSCPVYVAEGSTPGKATMESVYRDIFNIGKIFDVEERAAALVDKIREKIMRLPTRPLQKPPVKVFVYDRGKNIPGTSFADTLENHLISLSGGNNVFGDRHGAYKTVTWQEVADKNPDYIIVHEYMDYMSPVEKIEWIKAVPELSNCAAVQNNHFIVLKLSEVFPGVQNAQAAEKMCMSFDPDAL